MNKDEKRALGSAALHRKELRRKRLMDNKAYQAMNGLTISMRSSASFLAGVMPLPCSALCRSSISRRESSRAFLLHWPS